MNKETLELIEAIHKEAQRAYWRTSQDCGSDFDENYCNSTGCKHYEQCKATKYIDFVIKSRKG